MAAWKSWIQTPKNPTGASIARSWCRKNPKLLQQFLDLSRVMGGGLARSAGAEIDSGLPILNRQGSREGLHGTGCAQNDFVRLIDRMRCMEQRIGGSGSRLSGQHHAPGFFQGKIQRH